MVKAVLFDFRDTLVDVSKAMEEQTKFLFNYCAKRTATNFSFYEFKEHSRQARVAICTRFGKNQYIHNWPLLINKHLLDSLGVNVEGKDFENLMNDLDKVFVENVLLFPDSVTILDFLKSNGIKMGVIIDGTAKREKAIITKLDLHKYLSVIIISEEVGKNKFSSLPLETALNKLGLLHSEVVVVGDRIDKDILPANKLGCYSVRLIRGNGRYSEQVSDNIKERPKKTISKLSEIAEFV